MYLPNFERDQPGDTYQISPLTILLFGIVDNATEDGFVRMNAYIWKEFDGNRGAIKIVSCLMKYFNDHWWFNLVMHGDLTIITDNCP